MMTVKRIVLLALFVTQLSGCMTFEGPDHKYVLTQEGIKEVAKNKSTEEGAGDSTRSTSVTQSTTVTSQRGSNFDEAVGGCGRWRGKIRGKDPDPWTSFEFVLNKDIDVAYPRVMREFGYTRLETVYHYGSGIPICDIHSRYEEVPGSHYQMRNFIKHVYGNEESENTIEVDLSKEDIGKVRVRVSYYSGNTIDKQGYEASLLNRIKQALR